MINMANSNINIDIGLNMDMQKYYDQLVLYRNSIDAQIKVLADSVNICSHNKTEVLDNGVIICANKHCYKVMGSTNKSITCVKDWAI
jgi:transcriptional regulator of NAD metabolism